MEAEKITEFLFTWSDKDFSVGIKEVDEQHHKLVDIVNELHSAIKNKQGRAISMEIISRLAEHTRTHFLFEESLMRVTRYPDAALHKQQHDSLINTVGALQEKLVKENAPISFELLHFLKNWLAHHICEDDKSFGLYFQMSSLKKNTPGDEDDALSRKKPWWKFW